MQIVPPFKTELPLHRGTAWHCWGYGDPGAARCHGAQTAPGTRTMLITLGKLDVRERWLPPLTDDRATERSG
jgi:hypothetical protein